MNDGHAPGHYARLRRELLAAYTSTTCDSGLIERLTRELESFRIASHDTMSEDEASGDMTMPGTFALQAASEPGAGVN